MRDDEMLIILSTLAKEIDMLTFRVNAAEQENMKLRNEIRAIRENQAHVDTSELHAHSTTIDMISPEALRHE